MSEQMAGGCMCGRIRFVADVDNDEAYLCHCRMCQKASGNVSLAFKNLQKSDVRWEGEPDYYASSPIALRGYCRECGTSLSFEYHDSPAMDLTVAAFDRPGYFRPTSHFGVENMHRAWLGTEGLPETRTDEHQPLVQRWERAVGGMPD